MFSIQFGYHIFILETLTYLEMEPEQIILYFLLKSIVLTHSGLIWWNSRKWYISWYLIGLWSCCLFHWVCWYQWHFQVSMEATLWAREDNRFYLCYCFVQIYLESSCIFIQIELIGMSWVRWLANKNLS